MGGRFKFRFKPAAPGQGHVGPYPASTSGSSKPFEANAIAYDKVAKAAHHVALTNAMEVGAKNKIKAEKAFVHKRRAQAKAAHAAAAAADKRLRQANQDLVKAQQSEFSAKLTAESRGP